MPMTQHEFPDAFTTDHQVFNKTPPDDALYALLTPKAALVSANFNKYKDSSEWLIARTRPLPTKVIMTLLVVFSVAFWGLAIYLIKMTGREPLTPAWVLLPIWWLLVLPGILVGCIIANRYIQNAEDSFRVDKAEGRLILPRHGIELDAEDILEFVELRRWRARTGGNQKPIFLTSVLFRNTDGQIEQRAIVGLLGGRNPFQTAPADRLGEILGKPVRYISLGLFDSRGLGDN